jgi:hypothetical protein
MLVDSEMQTLAAGQPKIRGWAPAEERVVPLLKRARIDSKRVELHIGLIRKPSSVHREEET